MKDGITRRQVTAGAALGAGIMIVPSHVLGREGTAPSDKLNIAAVGCGGKGTSDLVGVESENIVAMCDIDWNRASRSADRFPEARRYTDFREMFDAENDIDAVMVSTADHTHAIITLQAIAQGKHVFCQKPLTRTIWEARKVGEAAAQAGVVTQMGNQGRAGDGTRLIHEWLDAGVIGQVHKIDYWTNRPIWPQALRRPSEAHNIPEHVAWDLWLGPAADRPYHPDYYHPFNWRGWWDFGTGAIGDIACHAMDAAFWIFDLSRPSWVTAETTQLYTETAPAACRIQFDYDATDTQPALEVVWRDGNLRPSRPKFFDGGEWPGARSGQLYHGEEGIIVAGIYGEKPTIYPQALQEKVLANPPEQKFERKESHYREWIDAIKGEDECGSDFATHAGPLTELGLLGNVAVRTGRPIEWDAKNLKAKNYEVPEELIKPLPRAGWEIEA